ncbi:MAG: ATP phosphoribosyltransferase regulatory subunit, partial [Rhizomicrobium sp.]
MADGKQSRPKARTVRGFRDRAAGELAAERAMLDTIRLTYESYGFDALETPFLEYTDALGKFLPDIDRPNAGVFSFRDDDEQWVSLRYDLTAPLARYVAENQQFLPRPFRRYQIGTVFRNDKPGPGRFREFIQCDADTVGTASPAADAEMVMMFADTLEALGLKRGEYAIKLNSRKLLDGVLEAAGLPVTGSDEIRTRRGIVLRAMDKLDRVGTGGVRALLGAGRK